MEILNALFRSLISLVVLFAFTKLIGKRQIADMSLFDYINGMTIGSIAGELATGVERNILVGVVAMSFYGIVVFLIDMIDRKSIKARRFFSGTPSILYENGKFIKKNFSKSQVSISEFQEMCRVAGYYYISDIESAQLESNGRLSVLPKRNARTMTYGDLKNKGDGSYTPEKPPVSVIYDGKILNGNLAMVEKSEAWLEKEVKRQKYTMSEVFLATLDERGELSVYPVGKEEKNKG